MSRFERWLLWSSTVLVVVTGAGLLVTKYLMTSTDPWAVVNHPSQAWFLKAHIVVSPLLIFAVGSITFRHIWQHYRSGQSRGRHTGIATALVTVPMVVSGYLITTLLIREHSRTGRISLSAFYMRRAIRIFPALYVFVAIQSAWVLRPFIGSPDIPFTWFRQRQGNFIQAVFGHLERLLDG